MVLIGNDWLTLNNVIIDYPNGLIAIENYTFREPIVTFDRIIPELSNMNQNNDDVIYVQSLDKDFELNKLIDNEEFDFKNESKNNCS